MRRYLDGLSAPVAFHLLLSTFPEIQPAGGIEIIKR
jgi:hypothetical protein